jgi:hypothetical protein
MDTLINLTGVREKYDINISSTIQNIMKKAEDINNLLTNTQEMIINYTNDDLNCMNDITIERIDNIANLFIDEFRIFCISIFTIDMVNIDLFIMQELKDIFINQELSILRLDNLLTKNINDYIKNIKILLNKEANKILQEYNIYDKINQYIKKSNDNILEKYMNEIINNIFPSNYINITHTNYDIDNLLEFIKIKYVNIEIIKNDDNFYKWNENIILYEIDNKNNNKKIYVYIDIEERNDKIETLNVIDLDINKVFCITDKNNVNNYICALIEKYL